MHKENLLHALHFALVHRGFCAPNPAVGCVITIDKNVIATGYHLGPGTPHAEVNALSKLSHVLEQAVMYVTLEPCCHYGRTPPCTEAIIQSGIKKVIYAYRDPNSLVASKGEMRLKEAGIHCEHIAVTEIDEFYQSYDYWQQTKKPFITAKLAMTLDGVIADKDSQPIKITGAAINQYTHQQRRYHDAILTTVKTIIADDPQLNVRLASESISKPLYILDTNLNLPLNANIFTTAKSITLFHAKDISNERKAQLTEKQVRCIDVEMTEKGLNLDQVIQHIGQDGVHDLWIEAGAKCFAAFMERELLHRALIYIAPKQFGEGITAFQNKIPFDFTANKIRYEQIGQDLLCEIRW